MGVEADNFAARIYEWATGVSRIDGGVGLNPSAGTRGSKFADSAYHAFGDTEEHGIARTTYGENGFTLLDRGGFG